MRHQVPIVLLVAHLAVAQSAVEAPQQVPAQVQFPVIVHFDQEVAPGSTANLLLLGDRQWSLNGDLSAPVTDKTATFSKVSLQGERGHSGSVRLVAVVISGGRTVSVSSQPIQVGAAPLPGVSLKDQPFGGIGLDLKESDGWIRVIQAEENLPADQAGIGEGDRLERIEGTGVRGASLEQARRLLRGPVGSPVRVLVRHSNDQSEDYNLLRAELHDYPLSFDYVPSQRNRVPFQISVFVRDDAGNGLPGAKVTVRMDPKYKEAGFLFISTDTRMAEASGLLTQELVATTGADGRATLWVKLLNNITPYDFRFTGVAEWGDVRSQSVPSNVFTVYDFR
jgi:hypothetical protein